MPTYRFLILDVFTDRPFAGNQLAVFTKATGLTDEQMQLLAQEFGFSETAFALPAEKDGDFRLRIFTPAHELPFAGHPTLGAAFAMAGPLQSSLVRIETDAGVVPVRLEREGAKLTFGWMEQPVPGVEAWAGDREALFSAIGVKGSALPVEVYDNGVRHLYVALESFDEVAVLRPDTAALAALAPDTGVNVFAAQGTRAKTRMFWADAGVAEDAATGSAAGPLAVHLARHGRLGWGEEVVISQGEEIGRPSTLHARAHGDGDGVTAVECGGSAVVVARGEFAV
jgi:trans-2,3-dihydro-3-hydroxyanthranilate isomerase